MEILSERLILNLHMLSNWIFMIEGKCIASKYPMINRSLILEIDNDKKISIIGVDFAGVRNGKEHTPKDQYCADRGVFIVENLCNLKAVVDAGGECIVNTYPMNYAEMTGLPCRVVAEV